jgi:hypothetical protein
MKGCELRDVLEMTIDVSNRRITVLAGKKRNGRPSKKKSRKSTRRNCGFPHRIFKANAGTLRRRRHRQTCWQQENSSPQIRNQ